MPGITFNPSGRSIRVDPETTILDAAREADVRLEVPCGGRGTCNGCRVRVIEGTVDAVNPGLLRQEQIAEGYVLACQARLREEGVVVDVPDAVGGAPEPAPAELDETGRVSESLLPTPERWKPRTTKLLVSVPAAQLGDGLSDADRLTRVLQRQLGPKEILYPIGVIRNIAEAVRLEDGKTTVTVVEENRNLRVVDVVPGDRAQRHYGMAIDVGTTTVALHLVDLSSAQIVSSGSDYNDQVICGLDVISRISYARRPERLTELRHRVLASLNRLIARVAKDGGVQPSDVSTAALAGNTTMMHLLLGTNPEYIRLEPYTPTLLQIPSMRAAEVGIDIHPEADVSFAPCVGSYVGGDITAGLLCTDLAAAAEQVCLCIDIGTNGELVVGNKEFLMTCACSAGPAFEGGGIDHGMRACRGAIHRVEVDPATGIATCVAIGGVKPKGICGSGMISLVADLFRTGWIDSAGKFSRKKSPVIRVDGRKAVYTLVSGQESGTDLPITISEVDIQNLIRAKAAIYAACALVLEQVGLDFKDLSRVYIAGGFGRVLDFEDARTIGLVPELAPERFSYLGNTSLTGTYMGLVSEEHRQRRDELARRMTYLELNTDPSYMNQFTAALFLPHTDLSQFPSVRIAR